jgi:hypothetical protein
LNAEQFEDLLEDIKVGSFVSEKSNYWFRSAVYFSKANIRNFGMTLQPWQNPNW